MKKIFIAGVVASCLMFAQTSFAQSNVEKMDMESSDLYAQTEQSHDLKDFKIVIEKTENGIEMKSFEGSKWLELTFNITNNEPQAIDEFGMTELDGSSSNAEPQLANYLFTIMSTEKGIVLKGLEGTAWTDLSFILDNYEQQAIDQFGMTVIY